MVVVPDGANLLDAFYVGEVGVRAGVVFAEDEVGPTTVSLYIAYVVCFSLLAAVDVECPIGS